MNTREFENEILKLINEEVKEIEMDIEKAKEEKDMEKVGELFQERDRIYDIQRWYEKEIVNRPEPTGGTTIYNIYINKA